ncbi:hypothetical protein [Massilicoli timonensis]|uniref:hypothetical protein n=1 Tax=Massilicoli timonensis TaxID=2015901 RepID=UPI0015E0F755|nr:hypothetical protein [Massilicoli timonensis]
MLKKVNKATLMTTEIAPKATCYCKATCFGPASERSNFYEANQQAASRYGKVSDVQ